MIKTDVPNLMKTSCGIVNVDTAGYNLYQQKKIAASKAADKVQNLENRITNMETQLGDIKELLMTIIKDNK